MNLARKLYRHLNCYNRKSIKKGTRLRRCAEAVPIKGTIRERYLHYTKGYKVRIA